MNSVLVSQYVSFEKPKFVPRAEKADQVPCSGPIPCEEGNREMDLDRRLDGVGNRPDSKLTGLKADSQRLDNACHMVHVTPYKFDTI